MQLLLNLKFKISLKSLGIMGFGYGHLNSGMSGGNEKIKLQSVDVSKSDVAVVTKKEVVKEVVEKTFKITQRLI